MNIFINAFPHLCIFILIFNLQYNTDIVILVRLLINSQSEHSFHRNICIFIVDLVNPGFLLALNYGGWFLSKLQMNI